MIEPGTMVRATNGAQMKLLSVEAGVGRCLFVDLEGRIVFRFHYVSHLESMRTAMSPRSLWPEVTRFDQVEIEEEERAAAESRRLQRRAARKSKRSNKIKRRAPVAA